MRNAIVLAAALVAALVATASAAPTPAGFRAAVDRIDAARARRMTEVSWRPGCPVPLRDLRVLTLTHWDFGGVLEPAA